MEEQQVLMLIKAALADRTYGSVEFEFIEQLLVDGLRPDLIVKAGKKNIALIEIKRRLAPANPISAFQTELYFLFKVRFIVYTDGERFIFYDRFKNPVESSETDIRGFVELMTKRISKSTLENLKYQVAQIIVKQLAILAPQFPKLGGLRDEYAAQIVQELRLGPTYTFYFAGGKTDTESFEHQLFKRLLDNEVSETVYRYCAFNRAFQILDDGKVAMLGLPGMNDTTEPNYIDNYLNSTDDEVWEMSPTRRDIINKRFIMSCTTLGDDLMQWRLYGENARGACMKFDIKPSLLTDARFYLGRVKYADEHGEHPELLALKSLITAVRSHLLFDVRFALLYVWRHFFKPRHYDYESEVRLLYIHTSTDRSKKWIVAEPYSIVNPMVIFDSYIGEFPLEISEVMLGPVRPELKLNVSQLRQMLSEKGSTIQVAESERNIYR